MARNTYSIPKKELKKLLVAYGVDERNIERMFAEMESTHMHMNVLSFSGMLQRFNVGRNKMIQILRRLGLDDLAISRVMDMVDEERLLAESGRIYKATLDI